VFDEIANTFVEIDWMIEDEPHDDYDFIYDQIVSIGELVSTRIINAWFKQRHRQQMAGCTRLYPYR
jgi:aspartate kinase